MNAPGKKKQLSRKEETHPSETHEEARVLATEVRRVTDEMERGDAQRVQQYHLHSMQDRNTMPPPFASEGQL